MLVVIVNITNNFRFKLMRIRACEVRVRWQHLNDYLKIDLSVRERLAIQFYALFVYVISVIIIYIIQTKGLIDLWESDSCSQKELRK